jgi:hypothetical protein
MADDETSDLFQTRRAVASLVGCIVRTLNEGDPTFQPRFLENLQALYYDAREGREGFEGIQAMELMGWVHELLKEPST